MKVKLDENLPSALVGELRRLGHQVDTVATEGLAGRPDDEIWVAAQSAGRLLVTQDLDFSDARRFASPQHNGILVIRLAHPDRRALTARVAALFATESVEQWRGCIVVATDQKIRFRRNLH